jgi:hypothetical protein
MSDFLYASKNSVWTDSRAVLRESLGADFSFVDFSLVDLNFVTFCFGEAGSEGMFSFNFLFLAFQIT